MFKNILAALDDGETCDLVFERALTLTQATGANLQLLSVIAPIDNISPSVLASSDKSYNPSSADQSVWSVYQDVHEDCIKKQQERLNRLSERAREKGIEAEFFQRAGSPGRAICQQAKDGEAGLIVVGSHGRRGLSELWLGSVSNYVLHHAPCSVLVIREQA